MRQILLPPHDRSPRAVRRGQRRDTLVLYVLIVEFLAFTTQLEGGDTKTSPLPPMTVVKTIHRLLEQAAFKGQPNH
jgi:hypothetical protein